MNLNKTNVIVFQNGGYLRRYEKWFYGDTKLKVVTYYKYLGLVISSTLSWYENISRTGLKSSVQFKIKSE